MNKRGAEFTLRKVITIIILAVVLIAIVVFFINATGQTSKTREQAQSLAEGSDIISKLYKKDSSDDLIYKFIEGSEQYKKDREKRKKAIEERGLIYIKDKLIDDIANKNVEDIDDLDLIWALETINDETLNRLVNDLGSDNMELNEVRDVLEKIHDVFSFEVKNLNMQYAVFKFFRDQSNEFTRSLNGWKTYSESIGFSDDPDGEGAKTSLTGKFGYKASDYYYKSYFARSRFLLGSLNLKAGDPLYEWYGKNIRQGADPRFYADFAAPLVFSSKLMGDPKLASKGDEIVDDFISRYEKGGSFKEMFDDGTKRGRDYAYALHLKSKRKAP